jgi:hypothetical protein
MSVPSVTGFVALQDLPGGGQGLLGTIDSDSSCQVTGSNMAVGNSVKVTFGQFVWSGTISSLSSGSTWNVTVECDETPGFKTKRQTDQVTVTVTNNDGTSSGYVANVTVGAD